MEKKKKDHEFQMFGDALQSPWRTLRTFSISGNQAFLFMGQMQGIQLRICPKSLNTEIASLGFFFPKQKFVIPKVAQEKM